MTDGLLHTFRKNVVLDAQSAIPSAPGPGPDRATLAIGAIRMNVYPGILILPTHRAITGMVENRAEFTHLTSGSSSSLISRDA